MFEDGKRVPERTQQTIKLPHDDVVVRAQLIVCVLQFKLVTVNSSATGYARTVGFRLVHNDLYNDARPSQR